ncbi:MAG: cheR [Oscillospiraceae bacterium]|nr:cheR [Oscillospiraceae bacterium]
MIKIKQDEFWYLVSFMKNNFGINLEKKRTLIESRLNNYITNMGIDSFSSYFDLLKSDSSGKEMTQLINFLTTNYSYFMREKEHFNYLQSTVLPYLKNSVASRDLRIWSAGCSTGEEAYTLAMILTDFFSTDSHTWDHKILATDISARALETAKKGIYDSEDIENIPQKWKLNYFNKLPDSTFEVKKNIKDQVVFRTFNLMEESFPFKKKFHVIFCRNVMIYFDQPTKTKLIRKYYNNMESGGYLFIGQSESINTREVPYQYIMPSVYRKNNG